MLSENKGSFTSSCLIGMHFFLFLTWLVGLDGNSSAMLYIRGKSTHPCLPPNLMRKAFRFSPLSNSGFFINIQSCWEILFIPSFLFFYLKKKIIYHEIVRLKWLFCISGHDHACFSFLHSTLIIFHTMNYPFILTISSTRS